MSESNNDSDPGLFGRIRKLGGSLVAAVQTRLELISVEVEEERWRLVELLLWAAGLAFFSVLAVLMITLSVILLAGPEWRIPVLGVFSLLYAVAACVAYRGLRTRLKHRPPPFSGTLSELRKDREWLASHK